VVVKGVRQKLTPWVLAEHALTLAKKYKNDGGWLTSNDSSHTPRMSYPRPVLIPARSAVVRRNPNLLTWLRNAEEAAPNQIPYSGETVPSLSPPSWAETIVRRVREWDEAQEVDPEER
jgi:hypothetical protein